MVLTFTNTVEKKVVMTRCVTANILACVVVAVLRMNQFIEQFLLFRNGIHLDTL